MEMIKTSHIVFMFLIISTSYQFKDDQLCSNCTNSHHVYYTDDTAVKYINGNITLANDLNLDIYNVNVMFYHLKHGRFKPLSIPIELNCKHHRFFINIILCSGDISLNPAGTQRCIPTLNQRWFWVGYGSWNFNVFLFKVD